VNKVQNMEVRNMYNISEAYHKKHDHMEHCLHVCEDNIKWDLRETIYPTQRCPATGRCGPRLSGKLRFRIFLTFGTMKVVRSSPLRIGRVHPEDYPGTHF
jgi:hypothetical protein